MVEYKKFVFHRPPASEIDRMEYPVEIAKLNIVEETVAPSWRKGLTNIMARRGIPFICYDTLAKHYAKIFECKEKSATEYKYPEQLGLF
jgi:hypothetical protein